MLNLSINTEGGLLNQKKINQFRYLEIVILMLNLFLNTIIIQLKINQFNE
jgi:hypothetical protein